MTGHVENSLGLMANELNCDIIVTEFEHESHYYINFWTKNLKKGMNTLIKL